MTGFLKLIGVWNIAAWFGAVILYTFGVSPALRSAQVERLLGAKHFPFFSGAMDLVAANSYHTWLLVFGIVSLLHALAEKIYLGRSLRRFWLGLVLALFGTVLLQGFVVHPRMNETHLMRYATNASVPLREAADQSFRSYAHLSTALNFLMMAGLAGYLWRVANPPESTRFIPAGKFRGKSGVDFSP